MKKFLICALIAMLALSGCAPVIQEAAAPTPLPEPTAAPTPTEAPAAPAATPTPKATPKPTPKPTATPKAPASASPSPTPDSLALMPTRREPFETLRTMGRTPVAFDPGALARALRCREGETVSVDAEDLTDALESAALPESLLPVYEEGTLLQVSYHTVESLPIGGRSREAALFLLDYHSGWDVTVLLFLREEGDWMLSDALSAGGMHGFTPALPSYIRDHTPQGIALNDDTFLLYSGQMKNAWLVVRSYGHGTGYLCVWERWYNLHTAETEISAVLRLQESVGFNSAEFAQGVVMPYDLSMMKVYEQISHVTGDPWAGAKEDNSGVWTRRYTFNKATFRMELDWERYDEGVSMAYAMAVIDGPLQ